jgi:hypothetical protein
LKKPSLVPKAYEASLKEMARRRKYRLILDSATQKVKDFIRDEKDRRLEFRDNLHTYLPS